MWRVVHPFYQEKEEMLLADSDLYSHLSMFGLLDTVLDSSVPHKAVRSRGCADLFKVVVGLDRPAPSPFPEEKEEVATNSTAPRFHRQVLEAVPRGLRTLASNILPQ